MKRLLFTAAAIAVLAAACGGGGGDHSSMNKDGSTSTSAAVGGAGKTVNIDMVDIAYEPKTLSVQRGERVEFVFNNKGAIAHDAFIGDTAAQADHEKEMREGQDGSMAGGHGKSDKAITVDSGKTGSLSYTFDKPGTFEIGCHQPGHYTAGMKIAVTVA